MVDLTQVGLVVIVDNWKKNGEKSEISTLVKPFNKAKRRFKKKKILLNLIGTASWATNLRVLLGS